MNLLTTRERPTAVARSSFNDLLDRWFDGFWTQPGLLEPAGQFVPPVNVAETDKSVTVSLDLPGFDEKNIQIQLMGNQLSVSGERKWEEERKDKEFHRVESRYGAFSRVLTLPENLKTDGVDAVYKRGVLTLTFSKVEPTPATRIKVKNAD